ncbi:MAG: NAD(P)/FAD-dependent oxidoreductase [Cellulosilyticaceae bacterium]
MQITIVGGGAAGLVAAIVAARKGAKVTILERQNRIGKKILVTGNGRCNLTNTYLAPKHFHTSSNKDCFGPIQCVNHELVMAFFEELGILPLVENKKVYPLSEQATSVLDVMRIEIERLGINLCTDVNVIKVQKKSERFIAIDETGTKWESDKIIMATGGMAAPQLGCDETGYEILKKLGHAFYETHPTLVHILSPSRYCKMMQGAKIKGTVGIYASGKLERKEEGEILFTEDGLSGPPIFQVSRIAGACKQSNVPCHVEIDFFPNFSKDQMIATMYDRIARNPAKSIEEMFLGWLHKRMIVPIIKNADIGSMTALCENLEYDMIERLAESMKCFRFDVDGTRGFKFAQATAGGIDLKDIDLETMESQKVSGLFAVGEILDVDGDCGGYNLQWAWATGYIAGENAAKGGENK